MQQIVFVVELGRVDKNTHHTTTVLTHATFDERKVAIVQGSHRGDETYLFAFGAICGDTRL